MAAVVEAAVDKRNGACERLSTHTHTHSSRPLAHTAADDGLLLRSERSLDPEHLPPAYKTPRADKIIHYRRLHDMHGACFLAFSHFPALTTALRCFASSRGHDLVQWLIFRREHCIVLILSVVNVY